MGMLSSFLHPERAYKAAGQEAQRYYGQAQSAISPYAEQGQAAYAPLSGAMQSLLNPQDMYGEWAQGYEASPYAQSMADIATQQGLNAASSMGLLGSTPALQAIQKATSDIVGQDRERYLDRLLNKYLAGANIAQNMYGQGAGVGSQLANLAMNQGQNMAQAAYGQQAAPGNLFGSLLGTGIGFGATALGGPIGGALASRFIGPQGMGG